MTRAAAPVAAGLPRHGALDEPGWKWPVDLSRYDRATELSATERQALARLCDEVRWWGWEWHPHPAWPELQRLVLPLTDARAALETRTRHSRVSANAALAAVVRYCALEGQAYWGWSSTTWLRVLGADQPSYLAAHPLCL